MNFSRSLSPTTQRKTTEIPTIFFFISFHGIDNKMHIFAKVQILLICDEIHEKFGVFFFVSLKQFTKKRYVFEKHDEKKENNKARAL